MYIFHLFYAIFLFEKIIEKSEDNLGNEKNDKICNEENMEYKPLRRTCNNLIQDFFCKRL